MYSHMPHPTYHDRTRCGLPIIPSQTVLNESPYATCATCQRLYRSDMRKREASRELLRSDDQ